MPNENLNNIKNFYEVSTELGTSGQPAADQFEHIAGAGYEYLINLDSAAAVLEEDKLVVENGLGYFHIPVIWKEPKQSDLDLFFDVMDMLKGKKVFVHCAANARVSAFVYLYRICRLGMDPLKAKKDLNALWEPDGVWLDFINQAAERHNISLPESAT